PQWSYVQSLENLGFSSYEGMQLEASRRFRSDFFFQASYVFSKNLGLTNGPPGIPVFPLGFYSRPLSDRYNERYDRGNLGGSRHQRFLLTGLFPLPFGKGRHFGEHWGTLPNLIAGGWELSTVTTVESGPYVTPTIGFGFDRSNTNTAGPRPDRIGNGNLDDPTRDRYWDASAFVPVPVGAGRFGNAGAGILEGPGTVAIAAGLAKTFS